jgi:hypothetical protein
MKCSKLHTLPPVDVEVYPGGSGIPADFGFAVGGVFRSMTHCGGGGGAAIVEF